LSDIRQRDPQAGAPILRLRPQNDMKARLHYDSVRGGAVVEGLTHGWFDDGEAVIALMDVALRITNFN
jgi:hypothetical protein